MNFVGNCTLTKHLLQLSEALSDGKKSLMAESLLYGLGYPHFTPQLVNITYTAQLAQVIAKNGQTDILSEAAEKCGHCPLSGSCEVGALFKVG